jgi:hypothetical protein
VRVAIILDFARFYSIIRGTLVMKKVMLLLIVCVLFTGLSVGSVYAGIVVEEKSFDPQPEPPGKFIIPQDNLITLSDGRKLEFVRSGKNRQVYLIQKNGTRALADGAFTLPDGQKLTIDKGFILESK